MSVMVCKVCGTEFRCRPCDVRNGRKKYCSHKCRLSASALPLLRKTHGMSRTRIFNIWKGMKSRCQCSTGRDYHYYGGRGIQVCQEWADSFEAFHHWAKSAGYDDGLELDRINTNGNYEPANCRWATRMQQCLNKRKRRDAKTSKFKGVCWDSKLNKWKVQLGHNKVHMHIGVFDDEVKAALAYNAAAKIHHGNYAHLNDMEGITCI